MHNKNIFGGNGQKTQFIQLIYQELMKREFVSLADILCIYYDRSSDYYILHSYNSEAGYGELKKAFLDIRVALSNVEYGCIIDNGKKGKGKAFKYVGESDDPLAEERKAIAQKSIEDYVAFCKNTAGILPSSWFSSFFENTQLLLETNRDAQVGATQISSSLEQNLTNIHLLPFFNKNITEKQVLRFSYQRYGEEPFELTFHPQFLKEYNGRWFVFGDADREPYKAYNVPLDRIVGEVSVVEGVEYIPAEKGFYQNFFKDIIGVTHEKGAKVEQVVIRTKTEYQHGLLLTKKLHRTQEETQPFGEHADGIYGEVSLTIEPNRELRGKILTYGQYLEVMQPQSLREQIKEIFRNKWNNTQRTLNRRWDMDTNTEQLSMIAKGWMHKGTPTFEDLSASILNTHLTAQQSAIKAVNQMATLRNWLIGCYIVEYEQKGSDRAKYGDRLLKRLEERVNTKGLNETLFLAARRFYSFYPQIADVISPSIHPIPSDKSKDYSKISATVSQESAISATVSPKFITPAQILISKLSFSHIREIMLQDDPLARFFYETECIKGTWSVRELRRQISTNLYFRSGVSKDPKKLLESIEPEKNTAALTIRQPFTFEFLGLNAKDVVTESDLEDALITHLQDFLLELGKGFCFENRQKRMIIDDEYYFADLVFYNRILHCSVIVELKNDEFRHEYLGQLNAYVSYYKENEMHEGDNPPVGILLCTRKGEKMVEYALAGMDNKLFVSTYMLQLPDKALLEKFLHDELQKEFE